MSSPIATGTSPSAQDPKNAEANKELADRTGMKAEIKPGPSDKPADAKKAHRRVTSADVLEAFHRATGRDVIGDYYTKLYDAHSVLPMSSAPLFDALCRSCDAARLRWGAGDEWLTFRSASFFNDRPKEVPNRLLERWAAAKKQNDGALPLESLIEVSRLTDTQLDAAAVAEGAKELYGLTEWRLVRGNLRGGWRLLDGVGAGLRRQALSPTGLAFSRLPFAVQEQFAAQAFGTSRSPEATPENLATAVLTVHYGPKPGVTEKDAPWVTRFYYRYRTANGPMRRIITGNGTMAGNDDGKEPADMW
jgi:hypothetical protein